MAFGKLFKQLSSLDDTFKNLDSKIENFQKQTVSAIDKLDNASKNLVYKTDEKIERIDEVSKKVSDKLKDPKKS